MFERFQIQRGFLLGEVRREIHLDGFLKMTGVEANQVTNHVGVWAAAGIPGDFE